MYRFKVTVTKKGGLCIYTGAVEAPDMVEATRLVNQKMWWDCYEQWEYDLCYTGKQRV